MLPILIKQKISSLKKWTIYHRISYISDLHIHFLKLLQIFIRTSINDNELLTT